MALNLRRFLFDKPSGNPLEGLQPDAPVRGWLLTCTDDCFASTHLEDKLEPTFWSIQRIEGNAVVPHGNGDLLLQESIEEAIDRCRIRQLVVCGHWPCRHLADLAAGAYEWERGVEFQATGRIADQLPPGQSRLHVEHHLCHQLNHLRTYPAVAAGLASGSLALHAWLHDDQNDELFFAVDGPGTFTGRVALHPDHNRGLRPETRRRRPAPPPCIDPRDLYLA